MKLTADDIKDECLRQAGQASGSDSNQDEITQSRRKALEYYQGEPRGDEKDGSSQVQSLDVADMVHSVLSQAMPIFNSGDLVQFEANSEQDEEQARQESSYVNYVVNQLNDGYILWETLLKDCMLSKNSTTKVTVDIKEEVEKERYKGLSPDEMLAVMQPTKENQEITFTRFDEDKGNVHLKRVTTTRKLIVSAVAPENFMKASSHDSPFLDDCVYCSEKYQETRSDLVEQGYDKGLVYDLPTYGGDYNQESLTRDQSKSNSDYISREKSMQNVEIYDHYIRIDRDGDGISELLKVKTCGNRLLTKKNQPDIEEVDCVPYDNGVIILMGHRYDGLSIYDLLKNVQDMKTHFLRQWADNALANNHNKTDVVEDMVTMEDFTNGRPNAIRRMEDLNACREVPIADIGPSCQLALDYFDKIRTDRTGSSLDLQANQMTMPSNVGDQGVNTLIANLEKVTALFIKNFCETQVKGLYKTVHKYLKLYFPQQLQAKTGGQWSQTNPSQWLDREQLTINIPPTESDKIRQSIAIKETILLSQQDQQAGKEGITTTEGNIYQMRLDLMRLQGIENPEKYLVNPESPQAQQAAQQRAMQQQQMQQQQMMMQQQQMAQQQQNFDKQIDVSMNEIRRNWQNDKEELNFKFEELYKKLMMDKYKTDVKAETDEAKIVGDATTKLELGAMNNNREVDDKDEDSGRESGSIPS